MKIKIQSSTINKLLKFVYIDEQERTKKRSIEVNERNIYEPKVIGSLLREVVNQSNVKSVFYNNSPKAVFIFFSKHENQSKT